MSESESHISPDNALSNEKELTVGRRRFLKSVLGIGAIVVTDSWMTIDSQNMQDDAQNEIEKTSDEQDTQHTTVEDTKHTNSNNEVTNSQETKEKHEDYSNKPFYSPIKFIDESIKNNDTYLDTIKDNFYLTGLNIAWGAFANNNIVKLWSGNSNTSEIIKMYRENRLKSIYKIVIKAPVSEELLFRGLPAIAGGSTSLLPVRGIVSSYIFGKGHQLKKVPIEDGEQSIFERINEEGKEKHKYVFDKNKVPIQQYATGSYYWMLARRKGITHSIISHATTNSIALVGIAIESKFNKKYKAAEIIEE